MFGLKENMELWIMCGIVLEIVCGKIICLSKINYCFYYGL